MKARVLHLLPQGDGAMSCPDSFALTTYASLADPATEGGEEVAQVEAHLRACGECSARVDAWRHSLERWAEIDLVDREAWGDAYFDELQGEIEGALWHATTPPVDLSAVRKRRQQTFTGIASLAALLLLGFLLQSRVSEPMEQRDDQASLSEVQDTTAESDQALEAEARALGRAMLASLSDDDLADSSGSTAPLWSVSGLMTNSAAELDYFFNDNYHDAIDGLTGRDADELIERL